LGEIDSEGFCPSVDLLPPHAVRFRHLRDISFGMGEPRVSQRGGQAYFATADG
jgi:hypothetical protein